jgi:hypothetical protein
MNDQPSLLRNDGGNRNNWIRIKLTGRSSNRDAIGARVRVVTGDHVQTAEVSAGGSVMSQNDLRLHFGLGRVSKVDRIEILWPASGLRTILENVEANQPLDIVEEVRDKN